MNEYDIEIIKLKLDRIRTDILGLHLCMTMNKMYEAGLVSKEEYVKMLNREYETIRNQIKRGAEEFQPRV